MTNSNIYARKMEIYSERTKLGFHNPKQTKPTHKITQMGLGSQLKEEKPDYATCIHSLLTFTFDAISLNQLTCVLPEIIINLDEYKLLD